MHPKSASGIEKVASGIEKVAFDVDMCVYDAFTFWVHLVKSRVYLAIAAKKMSSHCLWFFLLNAN